MTDEPIHVLLVDDDQDDYVLTRDLLADIPAGPYDLQWTPSYDDALSAILRAGHDVYLTDFRLGDRNGLDLIREAKARGCTAPLILLTGQGDRDVDIEAMRAGVADYLAKDQITAPLLERSIRYAIEHSRSEEALRQAKNDLEHTNRQLEKAIERANQMAAAAEIANAAKSQFLANMSHEIRTPMNAIIGMTDLTLETDLTDEQRENLGYVKTSADALLSVVNDVLDFSKIEAGKLELDAVAFAVHDTVSAAAGVLLVKARQQGLRLTGHVSPQVPARLVGDPVRLHQVLVNLIGNALKFTTVGEVSVHVDVHAEYAGGVELHVAVADTGVGIPPDQQDAIFEVFHQADNSSTRRHGGAGLGLSISRQLVELMGGRIWVDSTPGHGSTFHFTARFRTADQAVCGPSPTEPLAPVDPSVDESPLRILLAEDNAVNQRLAVRLLERRGHEVVVANDGRQALAAIQTGAFDIVLMDVQMPVMDGLEATEAIRGHESAAGGHVPIIAMTAHAMKGDRQRCLAAGMDDYVAKPIRVPELLAALANCRSRPAVGAGASWPVL